jgi:GntR family transcriptional regulator/MocR family aminotransferase
MAKRTTRFPLVLPPRSPDAPAGRWLYRAIREAILAGRLPPGSPLPSSRDLARDYRLARGTVVEVIDELRVEGYLEVRIGSGVRVHPSLPEERMGVLLPAPQPRPGGAGRPRRLAAYGERVERLENLEPGPIRAFRANQPALDLLPRRLWAQVAGRRSRNATSDLWLSCPPLGYLPLREAVAEYLAISRGVACTPGQVVIVSGIQQGLDLVGRLFVEPGDRVAVEEPGYDGARQVFSALGARVVEGSVDEEGLVVDRRILEGVRLVYVTPAHQYPLGVAMSLRRRLALLDWASQSGAFVFEDDYDSEFRYEGRPLPALQGLDRRDQVIFAGSFSKVLFPSLRLGYLVVPDDLAERFAALQSLVHRHTPLFEQAVLADFIREGHFGRHIRRMRGIYGERRNVLLDCAARRWGGLLDIAGPEAGLQTVAWLTCGLEARRAVAAAFRRDVEVGPIRQRQGKTVRQGLQLGFAAVTPEALRRGVDDLALALEGELKPTTAHRST